MVKNLLKLIILNVIIMVKEIKIILILVVVVFIIMIVHVIKVIEVVIVVNVLLLYIYILIAYCVYGLNPYEKVDTKLTVPKIIFTAKQQLPNSFSETFLITINGNVTTIKITQDNATCDKITALFKDNVKCSGDPLIASSLITLEFQSACNEDFDVINTTGGDVDIKFTQGRRKCYECSNRGICDRSTRTCKCQEYFLSSGGFDPTKNEIVRGTRGDCSYYESYRKAVDKEEEEI